MDQKQKRSFIIKNAVYTLLILCCYLLQEVPSLLELFGVRPMLVAAMVVCISMFEGELYGGLYGLVGGLLCDTAAFHFFGIASVLFLLMGCGCGLLIIHLVQPNHKTAFLLSGAVSFVYGIISHYLIYGMWGYDGSAMLIFTKTIPCALYTAAAGVLFFILMTRVIRRFTPEE